MLDLSIIIVSWNAKSYLLQCIESLASETSSHNMEIIVVDNASTDGSPEAVQKKYPYIKLIQNKTNSGFAKANNIGIRQSEGRYVCLVNSDVKVLNGCIDYLCDYMDNHPSIGILGPKIINPDMTLQHSCRKFPTLWNNFCSATGLTKILPKSRIFCGEEMQFSLSEKAHKVDALSGCFLMVRRKAIDEVGLFDELFFIYSEDIDWCKRFWNAGWEVVYLPYAKAIHYGGGSSSNAPVRFAIEKEQAVFQYWSKHHGWPSSFFLSFIFLLHHSLRIIGGIFLYLIRPSKRAKILPALTRNVACLRWLLTS